METDTRLDTKPTGAIPPNDVVEVRFRPFRVFSWQLFLILVGLCVGLMLGAASAASAADLNDPRFLALMGMVAGFLVMMVLAPRVSVKMKGGIPPLRFYADRVEVPLNAASRRTCSFPYEEILSTAVYGRGKRRVLIIDTQKRAFVYRLREFADENAADIINGVLSRRILARPHGAEQWAQVARRQSIAALFADFRPRATQAITALIIGVFILQLIQADGDIFALLDMGANAPFLVMRGEWYRLVTANLLHGGLLHIYCNALFGYIIGALVERQLGSRRFLILVMITGVVSHAVSALWSVYSGSGHLFSVGISGALFGMLGAQAVLNKRFGAQLPGGYRFSPRNWWTLLGLNFLVVPALVPEVDTACHVGGFLSGIVVGWFLCRNQTDVAERPAFGPAPNLALSIATAVWVAGIAQVVSNQFHPDVLQADHRALIAAEVKNPRPVAEIDNELAWTIAISAQPTSDDLDNAMALATRALNKVEDVKKPDARNKDATIDTLATVYYRQGNLDQAISLEAALFDDADVFASQLARFLNAWYQAHGVKTAGDLSSGLPVLKPRATEPSGDRIFDLTMPEPPQHGIEAYALLLQNGKILGIADININPLVSTGSVTIPAEAYNAAAEGGPEPQLLLAGVDASHCRCNPKVPVSVDFVPMDPSVAALP